MRAFVTTIFVGGALSSGNVVGVVEVSPADQIAVSVSPDRQSPTSGIQEAIDQLGAQGGVVNLAPGEFWLRQSIRIRSHVTLQGAAGETVLRKTKQVGSKLATTARPENRSVRVESVDGFREGDEIGIFDQATVGWLHGHAIVKAIQGNELLLDRRVGSAFDPQQSAAVINYFPAITGTRVSKVVLKDLIIDGGGDENPGPSTIAARGKGKPADLGFTFAAINLVDLTDSMIEGCQVNGWPADGISLQRGKGNKVTKCVVENCRGEGLHPGGGLEESEFSENVARGNLGNGFFFCARVTRIKVMNNKFIGNQASGIGDLGHDGDKDNVVENNLCEANGMSGITLWDGESNTIRNNICLNNSQSIPARWSGILLSKTAKSVVVGNQCSDTQTTKTQKYGIEEMPNSRENVIRDNDCRHNAQAPTALAGRGSQHGSE